MNITDASHAICSNIAGGITPESTPVEVTAAGSVDDVTGGFSNESAALVVESFALDPSTAARPGLWVRVHDSGPIRLRVRDCGLWVRVHNCGPILPRAQECGLWVRVHNCGPIQLRVRECGQWVRVHNCGPFNGGS